MSLEVYQTKDTSRNGVSIDTPIDREHDTKMKDIKERDIKLSIREHNSKQTMPSTNLWWHKAPKRICLPITHTWYGHHKILAPPRDVHYIEFSFEYKMHKMVSPLSLNLEKH